MEKGEDIWCRPSLSRTKGRAYILLLEHRQPIAELTLSPSRDETLPVRSQELQTNAFIQNKLKNIAYYPLGMESN